MLKHIETWFANVVRKELTKTELVARTEMRQLADSFAGAIGEMRARMDAAAEDAKKHTLSVADEVKDHVGVTTENVKIHTANIAAELHEKMAADAKAIALFRNTIRMRCSLCGQLSWEYAVKKEAGKVICADCQKKGRG